MTADEQHAAIEKLVDGVFDDLTQATTSGHVVTELATIPQGATILVSARPEIPAIRCAIVAGQLRRGEGVAAGDIVALPFALDLADAASVEDAHERYSRQVGAITRWVRLADRTLAAWIDAARHAGWPAVGHIDIAHIATARHQGGGDGLLPVYGRGVDAGVELHPRIGTVTDDGPRVAMLAAQGDYHAVLDADDAQQAIGDFVEHAAGHAHSTAQQLTRQQHSVDWFGRLAADA